MQCPRTVTPWSRGCGGSPPAPPAKGVFSECPARKSWAPRPLQLPSAQAPCGAMELSLGRGSCSLSSPDSLHFGPWLVQAQLKPGQRHPSGLLPEGALKPVGGIQLCLSSLGAVGSQARVLSRCSFSSPYWICFMPRWQEPLSREPPGHLSEGSRDKEVASGGGSSKSAGGSGGAFIFPVAWPLCTFVSNNRAPWRSPGPHVPAAQDVALTLSASFLPPVRLVQCAESILTIAGRPLGQGGWGQSEPPGSFQLVQEAVQHTGLQSLGPGGFREEGSSHGRGGSPWRCVLGPGRGQDTTAVPALHLPLPWQRSPVWAFLSPSQTQAVGPGGFEGAVQLYVPLSNTVPTSHFKHLRLKTWFITESVWLGSGDCCL